MKRLLFITLSLGTAFTVSAQTSPYAGEENRSIKAMSPAEIDGYLHGEGMGLAKAAELNHYPGPKHVLDLAEQLALTPAQKEKTEEIFAAMRNEAVRLGKQLIDRERDLDRFFVAGEADPGRLESLLMEIGKIRAKLRYVHLNAHVEQRSVLTPHQIGLYDKLRGYGSGRHHHTGHEHMKH